MGQSVKKHIQILLFLTACSIAIFFNNQHHVFASSVNNKKVHIINMVPFYWLVGVVGGSIVITLLYVSLKKYNAEHKRQKQRKDS
ncbi:hypothetical protein JNUCC1_03672 [Lentibacillus sp. JNUCC-1]|nr:hypothetical protein [Lentibacillus sp. JNUCC-1]